MRTRELVRLRRLGAVLLLGAAAAAGCASAPPPRPDELPVDSALALLTFDSAWSRIANTHFSPDYGGLDWPAVHAELRPRAGAAASLGALRRVISDMLDRLGESHYVLIPLELAGPAGAGAAGAAPVPQAGTTGLEVRLVDGELLVWRVEPEGAAAAQRIQPGWSVLAIGGDAVAPRIDALRRLTPADQRTARTRLLYALNGELRGAVGSRLRVLLRDPLGRTLEHRLELRPAGGQPVAYGGLPPVMARVEHERLPAADGCVGAIRLNVWAVPLMPRFDAAVDSLRDCAGIIVDLRGNPGGVAGMVMGTAGHFLPDTLALGHMRTRTGELRYQANPRRVRADGARVEPFAGPLAVLVDEMSASTSEIFAAGLQAVGRARVFGSSTAGQALPALMVPLPTGDVLMHAIADFTAPGGARIEGRGVVPDVYVALNRADLLRRRDAPLEAAMLWITRGGTEP
jgi:carboxyl-terminal processing protease